MDKNSLKKKIIKKILSLKDTKKDILKLDTMLKTYLKKLYHYSIHPTSLRKTNKGFVFIHNGEQGGALFVCFHVKDNK